MRAALDACTKTVESTGDWEAVYWRAQTYRQLRNWRAASLDYRVVADSAWDSSIRTNAAIDLSLAEAKLHDMPGVPKALEEPSYLFDEKARKRGDLTTAYNNRCYAYLHLHHLHKALADCNRSLKFGALPDAVHKKEKIERLLKSET